VIDPKTLKVDLAATEKQRTQDRRVNPQKRIA
jgi:hypothetical protein